MNRKSGAHMTHLFNVENPNWEKNHGGTEAKFTIRKLYTWDVTMNVYPLNLLSCRLISHLHDHKLSSSCLIR
jgi:hypothetical protein